MLVNFVVWPIFRLLDDDDFRFLASRTRECPAKIAHPTFCTSRWCYVFSISCTEARTLITCSRCMKKYHAQNGNYQASSVALKETQYVQTRVHCLCLPAFLAPYRCNLSPVRGRRLNEIWQTPACQFRPSCPGDTLPRRDCSSSYQRLSEAIIKTWRFSLN